jgi:hypothetical protein
MTEGLDEFEDIAGVVKKGPILLRVGQCWKDRHSAVGKMCVRDIGYLQ